jgi:hypothetical protein
MLLILSPGLRFFDKATQIQTLVKKEEDIRVRNWILAPGSQLESGHIRYTAKIPAGAQLKAWSICIF